MNEAQLLNPISNLVKEAFYDVVFEERVVITRLPQQDASILARQMGKGYSTKKSK